jgi:hypothetical protein
LPKWTKKNEGAHLGQKKHNKLARKRWFFIQKQQNRTTKTVLTAKVDFFMVMNFMSISQRFQRKIFGGLSSSKKIWYILSKRKLTERKPSWEVASKN